MRPICFMYCIMIVSILFSVSTHLAMYIYSNILAPSDLKVAQGMQVKMFQWLATHQGSYECQHLAFDLQWTSADQLEAMFTVPDLPKHRAWRLQDQIGWALQLLRDNPQVKHVVKDGELYFATRRRIYSLQCRVRRFLRDLTLFFFS